MTDAACCACFQVDGECVSGGNACVRVAGACVQVAGVKVDCQNPFLGDFEVLPKLDFSLLKFI